MEELRDVLLLDLDDDGDLDVLGVSDRGVFVLRGEDVPGRFGPMELQAGTKGAMALMAAEEPGQFWLRWDDKDVADLVSWTVKKWSILDSEAIEQTESWALWNGWFAHGPNAEGQLVASNGKETVVLSENLAGLKRLEVMDLDGDGREDLILTLENDRAGWLHSDSATGFTMEEFPEVVDFRGRWIAIPSDDSRVHLLGNSEGQVIELIREGAGDWTRNPTVFPPDLLTSSDVWRYRLSTEETLVFSHNEIAHASFVSIYNASGEIEIANASEAPKVQNVQVLDFNGDGLQDVVYLDKEERELVCVMRLVAAGQQDASSGGMAWPWAAAYPGGIEVEEAGNLPVWDGIDQTNFLDLRDQSSSGQRLEHLSFQSGAIHGQLNDASFWMRPAVPELNWEVDASNPTAPEGQKSLADLGEVALLWPHVQHVPASERRVFSYFAKVTLGEWHHFVFTRDDNLRVKGYVDGECVMTGFSTDVRFDHRRILLGASYGTKWIGFFQGRLDEVEFSNKVFTDEEVRERFEARKLITDPWTQACISFESADGRVEELIHGRQVQFDGGWGFVDGISGQAVRFNGVDGRGHVHSDLAEKNMSVSYWAFIEKETRTESRLHQPRTILAAYGMYNNNHSIADVPANQPPAQVLKGFDFERLSLPEGAKGQCFEWGGSDFFVSTSGQVYVQADAGWRLAKTSGKGPDPSEGFACSWIESGAFQLLTEDGDHHSLDLDELRWQKHGAINSEGSALIKSALATQAGVAFVGSDGSAMKGWWKPRATQTLLPLALPSEALVGEDEWVGLESHWGMLFWVSRKGMMREAAVAEGSEAIPLYNGFLSAWMGAALAVAVLFGILKVIPRKKPDVYRMQEPEFLDAEELQPIIDRFCAAAPVILDTNGLDELLGLDEVTSGETRRSHRARLIRQCNAFSEAKAGQPIVLRKKDPTDRRRTLYRIETAFLTNSTTSDDSESLGMD